MERSIENIAVIGLGMVGASFAAAYRAANPSARVLGVDVSRATLDKAQDAAWITEGCQPDDDAFTSYVMDRCDLVLLATPVDAVVFYFGKLAACGYAQIITDTASTKRRIVALAQELLPHPECYVPGHPMAGSEKNGIDGADPLLFEGAHWILCPDEHTPLDYFPLMHHMLTGIGARVVNLPREKHDAAMAVVSHVPHIMASSLVQLACRHADEQGNLFRLAAGGFKDSTRIAAGSPKLWRGILFDNADEVLAGLEETKVIISDYEAALADRDAERLERLLDDSAQARRRLPASWEPSSERLFEARIPMENRQGAVADIVEAASRRACNIQSIDIDHLTAHTAVLDLVLTDEGDIEGLAVELGNKGFQVSLAPLSAKEYRHVDE